MYLVRSVPLRPVVTTAQSRWRYSPLIENTSATVGTFSAAFGIPTDALTHFSLNEYWLNPVMSGRAAAGTAVPPRMICSLVRARP